MEIIINLIKSKKISSLEVTNHFINNIKKSKKLNSFITTCFDQSIKNAKGMQLANSMGLFLQKTNITRDYLEDLVDNRSFYPADVWSLYHKSLPDLRHGDDKAIQCVNHIITDTLEHSQDCLSYLDQLHDKDVFRFCAIPQIMAIATLSECYNNRKIFTGVL